MNPGRPWTYPEIHRAAALWSEGLPIADIALALSRTHNSTNNIINKHRHLFPFRKHPRKPRHPNRRPPKHEVSIRLSPTLFRHLSRQAADEERSLNHLLAIIAVRYLRSKR